MKSIFKAALCATLATCAYMPTAFAQDFPTRSITMIVPFPPGGGNDAIGRLIAQKMSEGLKQSVIVDNRGGAGTTIGTAHAAKAQADGYTILLSSVTSHALAPHLYAHPGYDPVKDFDAVALLASTPYILTVGPDQPYLSVGDIIQAAKSKPGELSFASGGVGSNTHLAGVVFENLTGLQLLHVPYKGSGPALTDLISSRVSMMFDTATAATQNVLAGKLRGLAVTGDKRVSNLPDVPTFEEEGIKGFNVQSWYSIHVPAGTPPKVIATLNAEVNRVLNLEEVKQRFAAISAEPKGGTPQELDELVRTENREWGDLIRRLGVEPN